MPGKQTNVTTAAAAIDRANHAIAKRMAEKARTRTPEEIIRDLEIQVEQLRRDLEASQRKVAELESECDRWAMKAGTIRQNTRAQDGKPRLVSQRQAAAILGVNQSQISRWKDYFQHEFVEGQRYPLIVAASLHIPPGKSRGRKRHHKEGS